MKYLYKSLNMEVDAVQYKDEESVPDIMLLTGKCAMRTSDGFIEIKVEKRTFWLEMWRWLVKGTSNEFWAETNEDFSEKFEPIRKIRVVRKNNKAILQRRGKGFWGRVLPVRFGDNYLVLQNKRGAGRDVAIITYCDFEPTENELYRLRQLYLKKYKSELCRLISFDQFCGAVQNGQQFYREFEPVNKQGKLEL